MSGAAAIAGRKLHSALRWLHPLCRTGQRDYQMPLPIATPPPGRPASSETKEGGLCGKGANCRLGAQASLPSLLPSCRGIGRRKRCQPLNALKVPLRPSWARETDTEHLLTSLHLHRHCRTCLSFGGWPSLDLPLCILPLLQPLTCQVCSGPGLAQGG